jgi:hypothetical protein
VGTCRFSTKSHSFKGFERLGTGDFRGRAYPEVKRNTPIGPREIESKTTTLKAGDEDLDIVVFAKLLDNLRSVLKGTVACQVEEAPAFGGTDPANDLSQQSELDVDYHLRMRLAGLLKLSEGLEGSDQDWAVWVSALIVQRM